MWLTTEEYAEKLGISKATVYRWIKSDSLPHPYQKLGPRSTRINLPDDYEDELLPKPSKVSGSKTVAYCRVSTNGQKDGLKEQKLAILEYANKNGITIDDIIEEVGSGFNGNRRKLQRILTCGDIGHIIVEHQDRLIRTNYNLFTKVLENQGIKVTTVHERDENTDLMNEVIDFFVSEYGRYYGERVAKRVKEKLKEVEHD